MGNKLEETIFPTRRIRKFHIIVDENGADHNCIITVKAKDLGRTTSSYSSTDNTWSAVTTLYGDATKSR